MPSTQLVVCKLTLTDYKYAKRTKQCFPAITEQLPLIYRREMVKITDFRFALCLSHGKRKANLQNSINIAK